MPKFAPDYEKGCKILNNTTDDRYVIIDMEYSKRHCEIMYKVQNYRTKFDMFKIPEVVISNNEDNGDYEVIEPD